MSWDTSSMPDQSGRTVVVTGANSGLGYEGSNAFVAKGADVVMACRSLDRGREAAAAISDAVTADEASLTVMELDLGDLDSIASFADSFSARFDDLHVLCNNAGVMAVPRGETADGFERQFGVNHLGHFALTGHLLDDLRGTSGESRVVTQSSGVHEQGSIRFDDLQFEQSYDEWAAYAQSKLANLLFAYELDRRLDAAGADVVSVGCHPGYAATNLQKRGPQESGSTLRLFAMRAANTVLGQSAARGALPMLYAATAAGIEGGAYVAPGGFMNMRGAPQVQQSSAASYDEDDAERLWAISADLTGVEYDLSEA
ncbi:MAG: oxidoreductase [Halolamina sp.]